MPSEPPLSGTDLIHRAPGAAGGEASRRLYPTTPPSGLSLAVGRVLGTVVVTLRGELDLQSYGPLDAMFRDLIEDQGNRVVVVDLPDVRVADRAALGVFAGAVTSARRRGSALILRDPAGEVCQALQQMGLAAQVSEPAEASRFKEYTDEHWDEPGSTSPGAARAARRTQW